MLLLPLLATMLSVSIRSSRIDLAPPEPLPLGGYSERRGKLAQSGGEKLYARYLQLSQGGTNILMISLEMLTIPDSLRDAIQAKLPPGTTLFLAATHTHCAPDSQMLNRRMTFAVPGIARYSRKWSDWYADKIVAGASENLRIEPTVMDSLGLIWADVNLNRNRRHGPLPDPVVSRILGEGRPLITHCTAHATFFDSDRLQTSGDWPGAVAAEAGGMVLVGAIGDVSPFAEGPTPEARIQAFTSQLEAALKASPTPMSGGQLEAINVNIALPSPTPHPTFAATYGVTQSLAEMVVKKFAATEAHLTVLRLGEAVLVGVPGEPTTEVGAKIQKIFADAGFRHVLVCSHVNGWLGYILAPSDYDKGGYEATLAFHGRGFADSIWAAASEAATQLAKRRGL